MKRILPFALLIHSGLFPAVTQYEWTGAASGLMMDSSNWTMGVPLPDGTSSLYFPPEDMSIMPPPNLAITNDITPTPFILCVPAPMAMPPITFSLALTTPATVGGYTLSGTAFQVQSGMEALITMGGPGSSMYASSISNDLDVNGGTLRIRGSVAYDQVTGNISGGGNFHFDGGKIQLGGTLKTYTATLHIKTANLRLGASEILPSATITSIEQGGILELNGSTQTFPFANLVFADPSAVVNTGTGTLKIINSGTNTLSGSILADAGGGTFELDATSTGMLTISGNNTYSTAAVPGHTTVAGTTTTLKAGGVNAFGTHSNLNIAAGTTLDTDIYNLTFSSLNGPATSILKVGAGNTLTIAGSGTFDGTIMGGAGTSLAKSGTGTLTLNSANTYTGTTYVSGGTLFVGNPGALGTTTILNITQMGVLDLNSNSISIQQLVGGSNAELKLGSGTLTITAGQETNPFHGIISGTTGNVIVENGTTPTFLGTNTYTGTTTIQGTASLNVLNLGASPTYIFSGTGGTLTIGSTTTSSANFTINAPAIIATNTYDLELSGTLSGSSTLTKLGSGTLYLSGMNMLTTPLNLQGGTLKVKALGLGSPSNITFQNFCGVLQADEDLTIGVPITASSTATFDTNTHNISISSNIECAAASTGLPCGGITKAGTGILTLTGTNSYAGITTIEEGTLIAGTISLPSTTSLVFSGMGTGIFQAPSAFASFPVVIFDKSGTIDTNGFSMALNNIVAGTSGATFTKTGMGILTLSGANIYTGPTHVAQGTLKAGIAGGSGAFGVGSNITVDMGATLDFDTFANSVGTLTNNGEVISKATITATSYTQGSGGKLTLDFPSLTSPRGTVETTGAINLDGTLNLTNNGMVTPTAGQSIILMHSSGSGQQVNGSFTTTTETPAMTFGPYVLIPEYTSNTVKILFSGMTGCTGIWESTSGQNWGDTANWNMACVPGIPPQNSPFAQFLGPPAMQATVQLANAAGMAAQDVTLIDLSFNSGLNYVIQEYSGGGGSITLNGASQTPSIRVLSGTQTINAPIILSGTNDAAITLNSGSLTLGANATITSLATSRLLLAQGGGTPTITNNGSIQPHALVIQGNSVINGATISPTTSLTIASGNSSISVTVTNNMSMQSGTSFTIGGASAGTTNVINNKTMTSVTNFSILSGTVTNNSPGVLHAGAGSIFLISGGSLTTKQGASLGTSTSNLSLTGGALISEDTVLAQNYTQGSSGSLTLDFPTTTISPVGNIQTTQAINLAGALIVTNSGMFMPMTGDKVTILQSSGSGKQVTGKFGTVTTPMSFGPHIVRTEYLTNSVVLLFADPAGCSGKWISTSGQYWGTSANWEGGCVPGISSMGPFAQFTDYTTGMQNSVILANSAGTMSLDVTLSDISFDTTVTSYIISQYSGMGTITMDGAMSSPYIRALNGMHTINAPITLSGTNDAVFSLDNGSLTIGANSTITSASTAKLNIIEGAGTPATLFNFGTIQPSGLLIQGNTIENHATIAPTNELTIAALPGITNPLTIINEAPAIIRSGAGTTLTITDATILNNQGATFGSLDANILLTSSSLTTNGAVLANNYMQATTSTLQIGVVNSTNFGSVTAAGNAIVNGTLIVNALPNFSMQDGQVINLVTADSVTADFSYLLENFPPSRIPSLITLPNAIQLSIRSVAIPSSITNFSSITILIFNSVNQDNQLILRKCEEMRNRFTYSRSPKAQLEEALYSSNEPLLTAQGVNPPIENREEILAEKLRKEPQKKPWSFYIGPVASYGNITKKQNQAGFRYNSIGGLVGFDYVLSDKDTLPYYGGWGSVVEYRKKQGTAEDNIGTFTVQKVQGSIYGVMVPKSIPELSVNAIAGISYAWDDIHRHTGTNKNLTAVGKPKEMLFDIVFDIEFALAHDNYSWMPKNISLTPLANVQYIYDNISSYTEQGAGIYDLHINSQTPQSLSTTLGARLSRLYTKKNLTLRAEIDAEWQREYLNNTRTLSYTALNISDNTTTASIFGIGKNSWLLGIDLFATIYNTAQLEASCDFKWNSRFFDAFFYFGIGAQY